MKLQKHAAYSYKGERKFKYEVIVPGSDIAALRWTEGQELRTKVTRAGLLVFPSREPNYSEFKEKIQRLLKESSTGLTWPEIREKLSLPQLVPNNKWVRKLEREIGLHRKKEGSITYWYLTKSENPTTVFTIGYEGRTPEELLRVLKENNVTQLIDVRELALSRRNGFAKSALSQFLRKNAIIYKHFPALGSPREIRHELWERKDYVEFFKQYTTALSKPESQEYLTDLDGLARVRRTAIMCYEREVVKCHRNILKENLAQRGFKVIDL